MTPTAAEMTLARHYALKLVKIELQRQGRRVQEIERRELPQLAKGRMAEGLQIAQRRAESILSQQRSEFALEPAA